MNGLDVAEWDPATDVLLPARARFETAQDAARGKAAAKRAAQRRFGLAVRPPPALPATQPHRVARGLGCGTASVAARLWPFPQYVTVGAGPALVTLMLTFYSGLYLGQHFSLLNYPAAGYF